MAPCEVPGGEGFKVRRGYKNICIDEGKESTRPPTVSGQLYNVEMSISPILFLRCYRNCIDQLMDGSMVRWNGLMMHNDQ